MRRRASALMSLILVILGTSEWFRSRRVKAAGQESGTCVFEAPESWGRFRGGSEESGLAFEDSQGTLRLVTNIPCNGAVPAVALEVRRAPN